MFAAAKQKTPCIIFIDEIDAVGGKRSAKDQQAMKQTLNQLLVELDGFEENGKKARGIVFGRSYLTDADVVVFLPVLWSFCLWSFLSLVVLSLVVLSFCRFVVLSFSGFFPPHPLSLFSHATHHTDGLIVIGATNFPEALDQALIRPGRFDRHVNVALPDVRGRAAILEHYMTTITVQRDAQGKMMCDPEILARTTPGCSGADLANMINAAALKASTDGSSGVTQLDLEYARDKILMGAERTSAFITDDNKKNTAYHEAGHAVCCLHTPGANPIHKATVMPRGRALGMVWQLPPGDQTSQTKKQMLASMDVCMGGRIAEEMIFGKDNVTSGASNDLQQATRIARGMVMSFGMSDRVGKTSFDPEKLHLLAPETRLAIDEEITRLLSQSYERATQLLKNNRRDLEVVAKGLIEHETLSGEDVECLLKGRKLKRELEKV